MSGSTSTCLHIGRFIHKFTEIKACLGAIGLRRCIFTAIKCFHAGVLPNVTIENERSGKSLVSPDKRMFGTF